MHHVTFSVLEPRMFLSGDTVVVDPAALEAAKAAVMSSVTALKEHYVANKAAVDAARKTLMENRKAAAAALKPLEQELKADKRARDAEMKQNHLALKEVRETWRPVIRAGELDVLTDTEGETEEERAADLAKLESDRAAYGAARQAVYDEMAADRTKWETEINADRDAIDDAKYAAKLQHRTDEKAVKAAQRTLKSVFQADKLILADAIEDYRDAGGKKKDLHLPKLPKV